MTVKAGNWSKTIEMIEPVSFYSPFGLLHFGLLLHVVFGPLLGLPNILASFVLEFAPADAMLQALTNNNDKVESHCQENQYDQHPAT